MRYPAAEKLEIIQLVEQSHLPVRRSLEQIGIPRSTFYRWCDLYQTGGPEALDDCSPRPDRVCTPWRGARTIWLVVASDRPLLLLRRRG
jgi:transposase-like protein